MTFDPRRERRLAEHRVLSAALTLARLAGWTLDRHAPLLPRQFQDYLYVPQAELLLVPTLGPHGRIKAEATKASREARSDALLIMLGRSSEGVIVPYISVGLWKREKTVWHGPHLVWLYVDGEPWLVPDPRGGNPDEPNLRLSHRPLRPAGTTPWQSGAEQYLGFARANAAFASLQQETL